MAFRATYKKKVIKSENKQTINLIESINHFDFGQLTWDEIIILRKSEFLSDFRLKIFEWINDFSKYQNSKIFEDQINKYIDDAKFDFIKKHKPNRLRTVLSGIVGNMPLPIPINPIGIASSLKEIKKATNIKNDYGWLLFIQKAREKAQRKPKINSAKV